MKLSVITINLNSKEGLKKTIESVISQLYSDYEFIIIDGKSDDGSLELIENNKQYIAYWISEEDTGIYNAMNKGIQVAKGEYLYFLNSGDILANEHVFNKVFENNPVSDFICGNYLIEKEGKQLRENSYENKN